MDKRSEVLILYLAELKFWEWFWLQGFETLHPGNQQHNDKLFSFWAETLPQKSHNSFWSGRAHERQTVMSDEWTRLLFVSVHGAPGNIHPSWTGLRSNLYAAFRPVLTPAGLGPGLLPLLLVDLTGMELGPFREEACVLLPLATTDGLLREEGVVVAVWVFFMKGKNDNDSERKTEEWFNKRKNDGK